MKKWMMRLGLAGLLVALAVYAWSRMNQDYDEDDLEDEIPIEFDVPLDSTPAVSANGAQESLPTAAVDLPVATDGVYDTGVGPGADGSADAPIPEHTADDLTIIRGIGPVFQTRLNDLGIHTFADLVGADVAHLEAEIQGVGVDVPSWIEQARELAADQHA